MSYQPQFAMLFVLLVSATGLLTRRQAKGETPNLRVALQVEEPEENADGIVEDPGEPVWTHGDTLNATLPDVYGDGPRILGLEHCSKYKDSIKSVGVAGLMNTGTNALYSLLAKNCYSTSVNIGWQVPWHKHSPLQMRSNLTDKPTDVVAVALVKDPLMWMASECRTPYSSIHRNASTCPSPMNETELGSESGEFSPLIQRWAEWNLEYFNNIRETQEQPALFVRFENLLFKPEATISKVCECVGMSVNSTFQVLESIAKWGGGHYHPTNRSFTIETYAVKREALLERLTQDDRDYIESTTARTHASELMSFFQYSVRSSHDVTTTKDLALGRFTLSQQADDLLRISDWGDDL